ncbi:MULTISPECIES: acyl-CoA thioesterase [unclassified Methyloversatilis]|jgi:acyl-CoA thioesterase YciA|uniref:acyl-CoA thioesterase n=1 Tax=unclassified Methyloversatilis TaxID=2639971 RepID=UPI00083CBC7C|nr:MULTISPECIES: acyl-CoA thioesterase [unclassified Methyloversatilis]AOF81326.1 thioesterase superfamily protein [Methyloversatilis sp. RAC08]MDP2869288.1 acyl-CoA thioesterase [Methyloversatilis sp.]MDP3287918.1 acyl-CoA thioesterase [Methyloversatilis sp.]MDP3456873.1 acyl-CoA thioesterase [Methyloversatilis sp.]MDP3580117.1 acyl-CoA thioesterase [Methyloversatilis sp.]
MNDSVQTLPDDQPALRLLPMPRDLNAAGDIFGGWVMSQVDVAGSIAAMRRTRSRVVTVAVNSFVFLQPITTQYLVSFYASVARVGNTSITVDVTVYAETGYENIQIKKVAEATLTYVAVGEEGQKLNIPKD